MGEGMGERGGIWRKVGLGGRVGLLLAVALFLGTEVQGAERLNDKFLARLPEAAREGDFSFAYIGDVQINFSLFEQALQRMGEDPQVAFLIVGGDTMDKASDEGFKAFLRRVKNKPFPVVAVPGNHDLYGDPGATLFRQYIGDGVTSFVVGKSQFILLQNTTGNIPKDVKKSFVALLDSYAANPSLRHLFVVMHVPPFDPRTNSPGHSMNAREARKFFALLEPLATRHRTVTVMSSHVHGCFFRDHGPVRVVVSGGGGGGLYGKGEEFFHHYMKVHVRGDRVSFVPVRLEKKKKP